MERHDRKDVPDRRADKDVPGWDAPRTPIVLSPDYAAILAYYEANAPVALPSPEAWPAADGRPVQFVRRVIPFKDALTPEPAVSNVQLADLDGDKRPELLAADMRQGLVLLARPYDPGRREPSPRPGAPPRPCDGRGP